MIESIFYSLLSLVVVVNKETFFFANNSLKFMQDHVSFVNISHTLTRICNEI